MGLFRKTAEEKAAVAEMREADRRLNEYGEQAKAAGIDYETPEYQQLNGDANEAAAKVSVWHGGTKRR